MNLNPYCFIIPPFVAFCAGSLCLILKMSLNYASPAVPLVWQQTNNNIVHFIPDPVFTAFFVHIVSFIAICLFLRDGSINQTKKDGGLT